MHLSQSLNKAGQALREFVGAMLDDLVDSLFSSVCLWNDCAYAPMYKVGMLQGYLTYTYTCERCLTKCVILSKDHEAFVEAHRPVWENYRVPSPR